MTLRDEANRIATYFERAGKLLGRKDALVLIQALREAWASEEEDGAPAPKCACGGNLATPPRTQRYHTRTQCRDVNVDTLAVTFLPPAPAPSTGTAPDRKPCRCGYPAGRHCICGGDCCGEPEPEPVAAPAPEERCERCLFPRLGAIHDRGRPGIYHHDFVPAAAPSPEASLLEKNREACPRCGAEVSHGYGLAGGGIGCYSYCDNEACDWFDKVQDAEDPPASQPGRRP